MWLTTTRGFYSAVAHRTKKDTVIVRARAEADLLNLCERHADVKDLDAPGLTVTHTPEGDYHWRIEMPKATWLALLVVLGDDIDYPNFKSAVKAKQGAERAAIYMGVWARLLLIQREAEGAADASIREAGWTELPLDPHAAQRVQGVAGTRSLGYCECDGQGWAPQLLGHLYDAPSYRERETLVLVLAALFGPPPS